MADSDTTINQVSPGMAQKEVVVNANFDAASPAMAYGRDHFTTAALTWGWVEATIDVAGIPTKIPGGTIALTASATNYLYRDADGVVIKATSAPAGWPGAPATGAVALYTVVTGTDSVTDYDDHRMGGGGGGGGGGGYINIPQNSQSAAYTTVLDDQGKHILHPSADTTARTFTIDSNANVAYPIGTAITFVNQNAGGVITIAITSDTMRLAGAGTTGSRTLAANGVATALKLTSTEWIISGTGLT